MLDSGHSGMTVFDPAIVTIDRVTFTATDKGRNVETISGMAPEGAPGVTSAFGRDETVTFGEAGVHGFKCAPPVSIGKVALIVVGAALGYLEQAQAVLEQAQAVQVSPGAKTGPSRFSHRSRDVRSKESNPAARCRRRTPRRRRATCLHA